MPDQNAFKDAVLAIISARCASRYFTHFHIEDLSVFICGSYCSALFTFPSPSRISHTSAQLHLM
jgi:hypothetical protein